MLKKISLLLIFSFFAIIVYLITMYANIRFSVNKIVYYKPKLTTQFFDNQNRLIANYFDKEHRIYVKYKDIPPQIIEAIIAIEDSAFFEHNGVNFNAILRAIIKDIKHRKFIEGASTITQQLVKNILLTRDKKIIRKIKEIMLSIRLETLLSKEEILERYLNEVYFGKGYYGIKSASLGYFKKNLWELNLKEIAILAGLPRAPSFYDPTKNFKQSISRANLVIKRMYKLGWISKNEYYEAINYVPIVFKQSRTKNLTPYAIDYAIKKLKNSITDIKTGGYKIYLTIDLDAQNIAKEALKYGYSKIKQRDLKINDINNSKTKTLNGAIIVLENKSGKILALVGGIDYIKSPFNRAINGKRQLGSAIKPFIYQIALNLGYSTISPIADVAKVFDYKIKNIKKKWSPQNYEQDYKGIIKLNDALIHSRNLATINLVSEIGIDVIFKHLVNFGFSRNIPYDMSISLGSFSISPIEIARNYTIFSNYGVRVEPYLISKIINRNGERLIFDTKKEYILSKEQSFLMTSILKDVINNGTGKRAKLRGIEAAGKTGTTNKNIDAWFCGYTPDYEAVIWFGNDDNTPMNRSETGGRSAGVVFKRFFDYYLQYKPFTNKTFYIPDGVKHYKIGGRDIFATRTSPLS